MITATPITRDSLPVRKRDDDLDDLLELACKGEWKEWKLRYYAKAMKAGGFYVMEDKEKTRRNARCTVCGEGLKPGAENYWVCYGGNSGYAHFCAECQETMQRVRNPKGA